MKSGSDSYQRPHAITFLLASCVPQMELHHLIVQKYIYTVI